MIRLIPLLVLLLPAAASAAVHAGRLSEGETIVVDGTFDEVAWAHAPVVNDFVGTRPTEGFTPAGDTSVRILYDDQKLYFAWHCSFDEPTRVRGYLADREDINRDDQIAILLDPFGDGRRAYHFWLNALGVQQDMVVTLDGVYNSAWDAVFQSVGRITEDGYVVEVAIPFRSLRFEPDSDRPWRILLKRKFTALDEYAAHPATRRDDGNELLQFADLVMDSPSASGVGVELMPGIVGRTGWDRIDGELEHRPFEFPGTVDPSFGFKWQPTPSLALDTTINPDFSQIEADPNQIDNNLRFALFLAEQRPFFLEGNELYDGHMLYTRSIRDPIYGVKFSGKVGPVGIGLLHALDEAPAGSFVGERETPGFTDENLEGTLAFNTLGGARVDIGRQSRLAMFYADKEIVRPAEGETPEHVALYRGAHGSFRWGVDENTTVNVSGGISHTGEVDGDRITGGRFAVDASHRTRLTGIGMDAGIVTPDYRTEMGFLTAPDRGRLNGWVFRRLEPRNGPIQWLDLNASAFSVLEGFDDRPEPSSGGANASVSMRLPGLTDLKLSADVWDTLFADRTFQGARASFRLSNIGLEALTASIYGRYGDAIRFSNATPTVRGSIGGRMTLRVLRRLNVQFRGDFDRLGRAGEEVSQLVLYRVRVVFGFTRWLSLRFIAQGRRNTVFASSGAVESVSDGLLLNALVRIEPSPGTAVLIGWGQNFGTEDDVLKTQSIELFAKASVLIRL